MSQASKPKKLSLAAQIFIALVLAVIVGLALQSKADFAAAYIKPFGTIFLNLVKFIVGPIVLFSIMAGVVSMRDIKKVGQIGGITVVYYFCTTAVATAIGLVIANLFKNGFPVLETSSLTYEAPAATAPMDVLVNIFPNNFLAPITEANMLQVIVMALLISFAIILLGEKAQKAVDGINLWNDIFMKCMEMILRLSPIGVFCLLCPVVAANGAMVIGSLAKVILAAYCAYLLHAIIVYSATVSTLGGMSPLRLINMECTENLGASREVSSFVLPLGATINMDGTAIYQGVCAVFIASCYGIHLTPAQMITIVLTATLASVGTAGVPGAGMVMLAMVLASVGLPLDGIALVAGVDRIFDMGRTTLNITGDASCSIIVSNMLRKKGAQL